MKVIVISDNHWGVKRSNRVFEEHIAKFHESLVEYCSENGISTILHLGDFFDTRGSLNLITLQTVKTRFLDKLKAASINMIVVPGNHDLSYRNNVDASSVSLVFNEYENVKVYTEPTLVQFEDSSSVLMVPWIAKENEDEFISAVNSHVGYTDICCGHFEFAGFMYAKGIVAVEGMDSQIFSPKFDMILSGHYHSKSTKGSIHYLGTQYQLTWADYGEKKYFHVLDTKTKELTPVENPNTIFEKIFYDESIIDETDLSEIEQLGLENKVVKVVVLKRKNMVKFEMFMEAIYSQGPYQVEIVDESVAAAQSEVKVDTSVLMKGTLDIINDIIDEMEESDYNLPLIKTMMADYFHESTI